MFCLRKQCEIQPGSSVANSKISADETTIDYFTTVDSDLEDLKGFDEKPLNPDMVTAVLHNEVIFLVGLNVTI